MSTAYGVLLQTWTKLEDGASSIGKEEYLQVNAQNENDARSRCVQVVMTRGGAKCAVSIIWAGTVAEVSKIKIVEEPKVGRLSVEQIVANRVARARDRGVTKITSKMVRAASKGKSTLPAVTPKTATPAAPIVGAATSSTQSYVNKFAGLFSVNLLEQITNKLSFSKEQ